MKPAKLKTKLVMSALALTALNWSGPAHAGQEIGNGGDLICSKRGGNCKLFDFVEWAVDGKTSANYDARDLRNHERVTLYSNPKWFIQLWGENLSLVDANAFKPNGRAEVSRIAVADQKGAPKFKTLSQHLFGTNRCADDNGLPSAKCAVTAGVVNHLAAISAMDSEMAEAIESKITSLRWLWVTTSLRDVTDEGASAISKANAVQGAVRNGDIVRVNSRAYDRTHLESRVGLIFHEAVYAITAEQGDQDSTRAREISALLFTLDPSGNAIKKASKLLNLPPKTFNSFPSGSRIVFKKTVVMKKDEDQDEIVIQSGSETDMNGNRLAYDVEMDPSKPYCVLLLNEKGKNGFNVFVGEEFVLEQVEADENGETAYFFKANPRLKHMKCVYQGQYDITVAATLQQVQQTLDDLMSVELPVR